MAERSSRALRYAVAVFDVARQSSSYDTWLRQLDEAEQLLADPFAAQALLSPVLPHEAKSRVLARALPDLSPPVRRFLGLLIRRGTLGLLSDILSALRQRVDRERGVATALVTTAVPLQPREREQLASRLSMRTGKTIQIRESVDPAILGGVVAQIGDEIIDGSVRGRLDRLRRALAGS